MMKGIISRHYLRCPYCTGAMDLNSKKCNKCGAMPLYVAWEQTTIQPTPFILKRFNNWLNEPWPSTRFKQICYYGFIAHIIINLGTYIVHVIGSTV